MPVGVRVGFCLGGLYPFAHSIGGKWGGEGPPPAPFPPSKIAQVTTEVEALTKSDSCYMPLPCPP